MVCEGCHGVLSMAIPSLAAILGFRFRRWIPTSSINQAILN